jgi:hypothetical protein
MNVSSRRIALRWLVAASLSALTGCFERETVVGPGTRGSKKHMKDSEDAGSKELTGRPKKGR